LTPRKSSQRKAGLGVGTTIGLGMIRGGGGGVGTSTAGRGGGVGGSAAGGGGKGRAAAAGLAASFLSSRATRCSSVVTRFFRDQVTAQRMIGRRRNPMPSSPRSVPKHPSMVVLRSPRP